jgi:hypothetical protein
VAVTDSEASYYTLATLVNDQDYILIGLATLVPVPNLANALTLADAMVVNRLTVMPRAPPAMSVPVRAPKSHCKSRSGTVPMQTLAGRRNFICHQTLWKVLLCEGYINIIQYPNRMKCGEILHNFDRFIGHGSQFSSRIFRSCLDILQGMKIMNQRFLTAEAR